jgi:predicted GIY-YIG superfamily endonuclease
MTLTGTGERTALYRYFDEDDVLLYVGITDSPGRRWEQHMREQPWWPAARSHTVRLHDSREAAEMAERVAIRDERPVYNIAHAAPSLATVVSEQPWRCPACGWEAFALAGQIDHMLYETRCVTADTGPLEADLRRCRQMLERTVKHLARSQARFAGLAEPARRKRRTGEPDSLTEAEKVALLDDLRRVVGAERTRLADIAVMLRGQQPESAL